MVHPPAVRRIVLDAARLVKTGEIVVFGSASLAFWLQNAPTSRDVDLWVTPKERGGAPPESIASFELHLAEVRARLQR